MTSLLYLSFVLLVAILCTALICHWRIARQRRVSVGTLLAGAFCAAIVSDVLLVLFDAGLAGFTRDYWARQKVGGGIPYLFFFIYWVFTVIPCIVAALAVVIYYQKRSKRDVTPVA